MLSIVLTVALATLLIAVFAYPHIIAHYQDVNPLALNHQSSISTTRKNEETAVYRSVDVPHGLPLTFGMSIREGYSIRDGYLNDIWFNCLVSQKEDNNLGDHLISVQDLPHGIGMTQMNWLIHELSVKIGQLTHKKSVGLYSPIYKLGSISLIFSCFFVVGFDKKLEKLNLREGLQFTEDIESDFDVLFIENKDIELFKQNSKIKKLVIVDQEGINDGDKLISFSDLVGLTKDSQGKFVFNKMDNYNYNYQKDEEKVIHQIYSDIEITKTRWGKLQVNKMNYFQRNFVSSISSKLRSLPSEQTWSSEDHIMISNDNKSETSFNSNLVDLLSGLVFASVKISLLPSNEVNKDRLIEDGVSILCVGEDVLINQIYKPLLTSDLQSPINKFKFNRAKTWFSQGIFNKFGRVHNFKLRLIYSSTDGKNKHELITTRDYNGVRSIMGSRIVQERLEPQFLGCILKTNVFDYRVLGNERKFKLRGVASNCVEIKLKEENGGKRERMYIRGFNIGKEESGGNGKEEPQKEEDNEGWKPISLYGRFGNDGCFYEQV